MTLDEFKTNSPIPTEANFNAMCRFCIAFDIDWQNESYEECNQKIQISMDMLQAELESEPDELRAHSILCDRLRNL